MPVFQNLVKLGDALGSEVAVSLFFGLPAGGNGAIIGPTFDRAGG